jgi:hypothetical protein
VPLAENEHVVQTLAPDRADEPLHERVLPRAVSRREHFEDPHAHEAWPDGVAVDRVAIAEEGGGRGVVRERLHDLLGGPGGGGMLGDVEVEDAPPVVGEHDKDEEDAPPSGWHGGEIDRDQVADVVGEERPPGLDGGVRRWGISPETVRSPISMPSVRSSPWILGAPHRGFAAAIRVTRPLIAALMGGRPRMCRPGGVAQGSRKRRRPHRSTVSGATITRVSRHPVQTLDSTTQKSRSPFRSWGRLAVLLYTASCWRRARFSRASWRWPP